ncbi:MAG: type I-C CRISPR-associated protein Cas8c/Csd1, partial [Lacipirellulaceae bacterium]
MLLHALNDYYERLAADLDCDIAAYGYSRQQISFIVVLEEDGTLFEIQDARKPDEKGKLKNQSLIVLGSAKPSGSGINPCFLWDNSSYALGYKPDDNKPERTKEAFEAFRDKHLALKEEIDSPEFSAVCTFLETWNPEIVGNDEKTRILTEVKTGFGVFKLRSKKQYVHESPPITKWWNKQIEEAEVKDEDTIAQCLVSGKVGPVARLHEPKIKGVWGGQSAGALLVSFNDKAYESYGKDGGSNAAVNEQVAFQYCVALNRLLASEQCIRLGDTSVVFWTDKPSAVEQLLPFALDPSSAAEDEELANRIGAILEKISRGKFPGEFGEPDTEFYILGLAPNAARISVRFWWRSTIQDLTNNLALHFQNLEIARGLKDLPHPPMWRLLRETVRDAKDIPDLLEGALLRAIITGGKYPHLFYSSLLRRIKADREVRFIRAAAIKACLNRNYELELPVSLDPDRPDMAYHLGRLFAALEKSQEDALPGINATIKDRYFSSASSTPASVFPRLIRMNQHHLGKLEKGAKTYHEKRIQEIAGRIDDFPTHLPMKEQGQFA